MAATPGAEPHAPLRLCVVCNSPAVAAAFAAYSGSELNGRRLNVVADAMLAAGGSCDIVYVDASAANAGASTVAAARGAVLTLGSGDGFLAQGGMVEITLVDDALRFDVNLARLRAAQLAINPGVLKLARQVKS